MGVAKSLRKAGYLADVRDNALAVAQIMENNRRKADQRQFFQKVSDAYNKWKEGQAAAQEDTQLNEGGQVNNPLSNIPQNPLKPNMGQAGGLTPATLSLLREKGLGEAPTTEPVIPETQTHQASNMEKYDRAKANLADFLNTTTPMALNPNVSGEDLSRMSLLGKLAEGQTEGLKPKEADYFNLGKDQKRFRRDPYTGKITLVAEGEKSQSTDKTEEYERNEDGSYKVYKVKGQDFINKIKRNSGGKKIGEQLTRIPKPGEGQTSVNIELPELNIDANINKLTQSQNDYKIWDRKSNDNDLSEEERTQAEEQKKIIMGEIEGYTNAIASQMNDKVKNFEGVYNLLFKKIGHNPDKIDQIVSEVLKGKDATTIRQMKMLLHARIFGKPPEEE